MATRNTHALESMDLRMAKHQFAKASGHEAFLDSAGSWEHFGIYSTKNRQDKQVLDLRPRALHIQLLHWLQGHTSSSPQARFEHGDTAAST